MPVDTVTVIPSWVWEIDVTNDPSSATTTWTDITAYVRGATIRRGRQVETGRDQAGTCDLELHNTDRRFDFFNTAGAYYPNFKPMRRVRCRGTYSAVTYPLYYGLLDDPVQDYPDWGADAIVHLTCTDAFKVLAKKLVSGTFAAQRADVRIGAILDAVGWPAALRSLATAITTVDAITLDKVSALEHLQQVAESESGRLFIDASGNVKFVNRHSAYLSTSQATFGEQEINYVDVQFGGGESLIYNEVLVQRAAEGAVQQSAVDATSQATYLTRTLDRTNQQMDSDNEANDKADFELALYKDYHPRIVSMHLDGTYQPSTVWPQALGRELGDRLTARKRPPGGGSMIEQVSFIESIEHRVGVGTWDPTFGLTSVGIGYELYAAGKSIFVVGTSALTSGTGVLVY